MSEQEWTDLGYRWARYREINWYHAMADLDWMRRSLGDEAAAQEATKILPEEDA